MLMYYFSKVKHSYDNLNYQAEECFKQEDNNTITTFNYNDQSIKNIDIFKYVDYIYIKNQEACLDVSVRKLSHDIVVLKSLFNSYMVKDNTLMSHLLTLAALPTTSEIKFNIEEPYNKLSKEAKEYLKNTLGEKPFNIQPFRDNYTKKLERERELRLKK
jgi:hypothetical protein